jgi:hypothetical protein
MSQFIERTAAKSRMQEPHVEPENANPGDSVKVL